MLGIEQARKWQCGTLNEFRKFFGLKTYDTFEEINPDPYVAEQLKHLYGKLEIPQADWMLTLSRTS